MNSIINLTELQQVDLQNLGEQSSNNKLVHPKERVGVGDLDGSDKDIQSNVNAISKVLIYHPGKPWN